MTDAAPSVVRGSMSLQAALERVLGEYPTAVRQPLTAHPLAEFIPGPLADELQQEVGPTYLSGLPEVLSVTLGEPG